MNRYLLMWGVLLFGAVAAQRCAAQTLPPEGDFTFRIPARTESRPPISTDLEGRVGRARDAMRLGNLKGMSQELAGPDFVVDFKRWDPGEDRLRLAEGLLHFATGRWRAVHQAADDLLEPSRQHEVPADLRADAHQLLALTYYRLRILPLVQYHAEETLKLASDRPGAKRLLSLISELAGGRYTKLASILRTGGRSEQAQLWQSQRPGIQPLVVAFCGETGAPCGGALCVEAEDARPPAHYRLIYRDDDEDYPPAVVLDCGTSIPKAEELIKSMLGFDCRARAQFEALYFQRADLAPLASGWARVWGKQDDPLLQAHVERPLRDAGSWDWETHGRYSAGKGRPAPYEVVAYVNRQAADPDWRRDFPGPLEHVHFAVGMSGDRQYLGSYRLVSERPASGERVYFIQRLEADKLSILDVLTEPPAFEELRDQILSWVDETERKPSGAAAVLAFDDLDASQAPVRGADVLAYFTRQGVKLEAENGTVDVLRDEAPECRPTAKATSGSNLLGFKSSSLYGGTFTVRLSRPAQQAWIHRANVLGGTHPGWRATALDASGSELGSIGEGNQEGPVSAVEFSLRGPGIASLRFNIGGGPVYALFDDLVFESTGSSP